MKDELEAAIFSQTEAELLNLGVLTPRGQVSRSKLRRSARKSRPSSSSSPGVNKDHSNASKDNKTNAGTAEPLNNGTNLANKLDEDVEDEDWKNIEMSYRPASPRAVFLAGCLRQGVAPRAIAMLRKRVSPILDLAHMGIGKKGIRSCGLLLSALRVVILILSAFDAVSFVAMIFTTLLI